MSDPLIIDLFVEDHAHEAFLKPLAARMAREEGIAVEVRLRAAKGGHGQAINEFQLYQKLLEKGIFRQTTPSLVVVAIDGNCTTFSAKRKEIVDATRPEFRERVVAACPDPHVERWYLADPDSFHGVVGHRPALGRKKCARDHYKQVLASAVRQGGHPPTLGGIEFAPELVAVMDLYRAGRNDRSLGAFVDELRARLRRLKANE